LSNIPAPEQPALPVAGDGDAHLRRSFSQDISAVHAADGQLMIGLADARLIAAAH
jgi:hypothetical protein